MKAKIKSNHQFDVQLNMAKCRNPSSSHQPLLQRSTSTGSMPFHSVALFSCPYVLIELKSITICVLLGSNCLPKHQKNIKAAFAYRFTQTLQKKPQENPKTTKKKSIAGSKRSCLENFSLCYKDFVSLASERFSQRQERWRLLFFTASPRALNERKRSHNKSL